MAYSPINLGTNANDGTGDSLRVAGGKINAQLQELFDVFSIGLFAALSAPTLTTIADAETFYPIAGTFSNEPASGFTGTEDPAIKYTGTRTLYFEIDAHAVISAATNGTTVECGIKKNGTLEASSVVSAFCKTAGELYTISGTIVVQLEEDDTIQLVVATDNGNNVTFHNITTTIRPFKL